MLTQIAQRARQVAQHGETLKLGDGRRLGYAIYGDEDGAPCFYFHGFPGSRLEAGLLPVPGLMLVGIDRPGYGLSDPAPGRRLADWPGDVAALADHLSFKRFAVIGVSGGAPYAAACAHGLKERISLAALLCGLGPPEAPGMRQGNLSALLRAGRSTFLRFSAAALARQALLREGLERRLMSVRRSHIAQRTAGVPKERAALSDDVVRFMMGSWREGLKATSHGMASDARIYGERWPFALSDIMAPVRLWHGTDDRVVPVSIGRHYAREVPAIAARFPDGEGHFSVIFNSLDEIIAAVRGAAGP